MPRSDMSEITLHGRCHCGQLEWTVNASSRALPGHTLCHCRSCKLLGGGDFCGILLTSISAVRFIKGSPGVYTYTDQASGDLVHCTFCSTCTTHAYHRNEGRGDEIQVRTFPLMEAGYMLVDREINVHEKFTWVKKVDGATSFRHNVPAVERGRHALAK
ncbi:Mss4-like protein [Lipomyces oligophaga]|uniref:Mss4-like protein n=1 Tax=Lipomyces oligophaga TaxID=45792 RepID=UPI0034CF6723